jgi:hypothetical protein
MKKLIPIVTILFITSCSTVQVAKFTSVEKLFELRMNSSISEVESLLGSKPYNILSDQLGGYTIYVYKYKLIERMVSPSIINERGGEYGGKEVYNRKEQNVYLFFYNDKLESFVTTEGRKKSTSLVLLNNTLYTFTVFKDKYFLEPRDADAGEFDDNNEVPKKKKNKFW